MATDMRCMSPSYYTGLIVALSFRIGAGEAVGTDVGVQSARYATIVSSWFITPWFFRVSSILTGPSSLPVASPPGLSVSWSMSVALSSTSRPFVLPLSSLQNSD